MCWPNVSNVYKQLLTPNGFLSLPRPTPHWFIPDTVFRSWTLWAPWLNAGLPMFTNRICFLLMVSSNSPPGWCQGLETLEALLRCALLSLFPSTFSSSYYYSWTKSIFIQDWVAFGTPCFMLTQCFQTDSAPSNGFPQQLTMPVPEAGNVGSPLSLFFSSLPRCTYVVHQRFSTNYTPTWIHPLPKQVFNIVLKSECVVRALLGSDILPFVGRG